MIKHCRISFRFFLFIFLIPGSFSSYAQLYDYQGRADQSGTAAYGDDGLFVFHSTNPEKIMAATHSSSETASFVWQRFNKATLQFDTLFTHSATPVSRVRLDSLYASDRLSQAVEGLRVEVETAQGDQEEYTAWVVIDTLNDFSIQEYRNTCNQIKLEIVGLSLRDYSYHNLAALPGDTSLITLENEISRFEWTANDDVDIYWPDAPLYEGDRLLGYIGSPFQMPYQTTRYRLTIENAFGNNVSATSDDVEAKAVLSDFTISKLNPDGSVVDYQENVVNEALLQILVENRSKNANDYQWVGFNDSLNILRGRDSILWRYDGETPTEGDIPPYKPGRYPVRLKVSNEYGCVDSSTFYHVRVDSSQIDSALIPNVFTPDGNGLNDLFVLPKADNLSGDGQRGLVSMKWIEVSIFNRSGELVYRYDGDPLEWEGWRGKVRNSNRDAAEGIYLYVIKGRGYDGVMHENKQYSGFVYLFRQ